VKGNTKKRHFRRIYFTQGLFRKESCHIRTHAGLGYYVDAVAGWLQHCKRMKESVAAWRVKKKTPTDPMPMGA